MPARRSSCLHGDTRVRALFRNERRSDERCRTPSARRRIPGPGNLINVWILGPCGTDLRVIGSDKQKIERYGLATFNEPGPLDQEQAALIDEPAFRLSVRHISIARFSSNALCPSLEH